MHNPIWVKLGLNLALASFFPTKTIRYDLEPF